MNALCACGCGLEVARPTNRWVIGHCGKRKLSDADVVKIKSMLGKGVKPKDQTAEKILILATGMEAVQ